MKDLCDRWKDMLMRIGAMPVAFLGIGLYRAWLATFFRYDAFPTIDFFDYALFEGAIGVASFAVVFLARRVAPLWSNRAAVCLAAVGMVGGSALCVIACFWVQIAALKYLGLMLAGAGLGLLILMWTEFFGSLNPMRVAAYYAAAIFLGEVLKWLFSGLEPAYIAVFSLALPLVSLDWVRRSMERLPEIDLPKPMGKAGLSDPLEADCAYGDMHVRNGVWSAARSAPGGGEHRGHDVGCGTRVLRRAFVIEVVQLRHHIPTGVSSHDRGASAHCSAILA